jgi:hypothetical protein
MISARGTTPRSASAPPKPFANGGYSFAPNEARFFDPVHSTAQDWALAWNQGDERMLTPDTWHNLDIQAAVLRRGAEILVLIASSLPQGLAAMDSVRPALVMGRPDDLSLNIGRTTVHAGGVIRASMQLAGENWIASVEARGHAWRARARFGVPVPNVTTTGFGVSAPILLQEGVDLDQLPLLSAMLPSTVLAGARRVNVYFEGYGISESEELEFTLSAVALDVKRSVFSRIGAALHLTAPPGTARVSWTERVDSLVDDHAERMTTIDLSSLLPGIYDLTLSVSRRTGEVAIAKARMSIQ